MLGIRNCFKLVLISEDIFDDHLSSDGTFELAKFLIDKIVTDPVSR
jgi:hypothetical protein